MNPTVMYGRLATSSPDRRQQVDECAPGHEAVRKIEARKPVAHEICEEVEHGIEEGKQPEHPPEADNRVPAGRAANRRNGESNDDETERPETGLVGDFDERIGGEAAVEAAPDQVRERNERSRKDERLQ